jgi:hypothetical protein
MAGAKTGPDCLPSLSLPSPRDSLSHEQIPRDFREQTVQEQYFCLVTLCDGAEDELLLRPGPTFDVLGWHCAGILR